MNTVIMAGDRELLETYLHELTSKKSLTKSTQDTIRFNILPWFEYLSINNMKIEDIYRAKNELQKKGYKQNYFRKCIFEFRRFCLWLIKRGIKLDPESIKEIKTPSIDFTTKQAKDMLSEEEIERIISISPSSRDRAIMAFLYAGHLRPIELVKLTWGDIKLDDYGVLLYTSEKTKIPRQVRLLGVKGHLLQWKKDAEGMGFSTEKDAPLFISFLTKKALKRSGLRQIFYRRIKPHFKGKKIHPYILRHSRITQMVADGIPESAIKMDVWGTLKTNMLSTYAHLTDEQTDDLILESAGLKKNVKKKMGPVLCERCFTENSRVADYCVKCALPLSDRAREKEKSLDLDTLHGKNIDALVDERLRKLGIYPTPQ